MEREGYREREGNRDDTERERERRETDRQRGREGEIIYFFSDFDIFVFLLKTCQVIYRLHLRISLKIYSL